MTTNFRYNGENHFNMNSFALLLVAVYFQYTLVIHMLSIYFWHLQAVCLSYIPNSKLITY